MKLARRNPRAGFTIVEIIVAMGLLVLGMSAILGLLTFGAAMTRAAALRTAASTAVEAIVADLEESLFTLERDPTTGDWSVGEAKKIEDRPVPGCRGVTYSAIAKPDPAEIGSPEGALRYDVAVEMHWMSGGTARSKTFHTLLLRQVPFGERLRREFVETRADGAAPTAKTKPAQPASKPATHAGNQKP